MWLFLQRGLTVRGGGDPSSGGGTVLVAEGGGGMGAQDCMAMQTLPKKVCRCHHVLGRGHRGSETDTTPLHDTQIVHPLSLRIARGKCLSRWYAQDALAC
jgi:hypothetical protein